MFKVDIDKTLYLFCNSLKDLQGETMQTLKITFLVIILPIALFAQWYQQNSGITELLTAVTFTDSVNGYAVGYDGIILKTTNGGSDWILLQSGTADLLFDVFFVDVNNGWIVGADSAIIMHTSDGGLSWIKQLSPVNEWLYDIEFVNKNDGWIVGANGTILNTSDGGVTWVQQTSNTSQILKGICFIDESTGTIVGDRYQILRTTNGGYNWIQQYGGSINSLYSVFFTDSNNGWAVGDFVILRTTDGGMNWVEQSLGGSYIVQAVSFTDTSNGTAVGFEVILRTTNGGTDWIEQSGVPAGEVLNGVFFMDENIGWAVGSKGLVLHTTNGGLTHVNDEYTKQSLIEYKLFPNYPNPFNPVTKIKFLIPQDVRRKMRDVSLKVYDVLGNEVAILVNEELPSGEYEVVFNGTELPSGISAKGGYASGVYFYRFIAGDFVETKKMVLLE